MADNTLTNKISDLRKLAEDRKVYNWHHMSTSIYVSLRYVHNAFM